MSKFAGEPLDVAMLDRARALGPDAAEVVRAYLLFEGALHRIEEWPEHEPHYEPAERFTNVQAMAEFYLRGGRPQDREELATKP